MKPLKLRSDLTWKNIETRNQCLWVLRDPLSCDYFYLNQRDRTILALADGTRSIDQIVDHCNQVFAPDVVSAPHVVHFLADANRAGMLVQSSNRPTGSDQRLRNRPRWWQNPMAVRLPGVPVGETLDRLFAFFASFIKRGAEPVFLTLAALLLLSAALLAFFQRSAIHDHVTLVSSQPLVGTTVGLLLVLSFTKLTHELAHAIACRYFGADCRQIGILLLFGFPVLYCDVSDAWLLKKRWQRITVSAAGMAAELLLAAVATFLWLWTDASMLRDILVTVMVVCSISTILVNGNPLLRYDGYYILSDLIGIPNLSTQANAVTTKWIRRILWGDIDSRHSPLSNRTHDWFYSDFLLIVYSIASALYRASIYLFLGWLAYRAAESKDLGPIAAVCIGAIVILVAFRWLARIYAKPTAIRSRRRTIYQRPVIMTMIALFAMGAFMLIPRKQTVSGYLIVMPLHSQEVFVTVPGQVVSAVSEGATTKAGDVLAKLSNPELEYERLTVATMLEAKRAELAGLESRRRLASHTSSEDSTIKMVLTELIEGYERQQELLEFEHQRLTIRSPRSGKVFAAPTRNQATTAVREIGFWSGTPLAAKNRNAWLETGTTLCIIGDPQHYEASVLIPQHQIEKIAIGQNVIARFHDRPLHSVQGSVIEIASSPIEKLPDELVTRGIIDSKIASPNRSSETYYQVRVKIGTQTRSLPIRSTAAASIEVEKASLFSRLPFTKR
ncbi:Peptidase family M50 [Novipirellula aureliae]|uniref:Peptidase family M50 n=1 Tax=Novipirellula aureliae TaxID=2527966 RepID=A0A5C6DEL1_9BACT|nr:site-2 protease family protein [Novipirellula aureliae]TWU35240.1 Peptidase family M50 [Novipirellula aureliae]